MLLNSIVSSKEDPIIPYKSPFHCSLSHNILEGGLAVAETLYNYKDSALIELKLYC